MGKAQELIKDIEPDEKKKLHIKIKELKEQRDDLKTALRWTIDEIKKKEQELVRLNMDDMFKKCPECGERLRLHRSTREVENGVLKNPTPADYWFCPNNQCDYVEEVKKDGF